MRQTEQYFAAQPRWKGVSLMCAPPDDAREKYLERLWLELDSRRVHSELLASGHKPRLKLETPFLSCGIAEAEFEDNVLAAPDGDGRWFYWWPWIEKIGPVDAVEAVALHIARSIDATMPDDDHRIDVGERECAETFAMCH